MNRSEDQMPKASQGLEKPSRRRLLRGGLIAAPAVLALKSTPVLACNCKLPSGFSVSGNLSHAGSNTCTQPTSKPSGWASCGNTNGGCYTPTTWKQVDCFGQKTPSTGNSGCGLTTNGTYTNVVLSKCLTLGDTHPQALAAACYLQACSTGVVTGTGFPSQAIVSALWTSYCNGSNYSPSAGVTWNQTQILNYMLYLTGQTS